MKLSEQQKFELARSMLEGLFRNGVTSKYGGKQWEIINPPSVVAHITGIIDGIEKEL